MRIIAELCQNHNGDVDLLSQMVRAASKSGATHVKIQHIRPEILNFRARHEEGISFNGKKISIKRPFEEEYKRLSKLTLSDQSVKDFISICKDQGVKPLTTCFARCDVKKIKNLGFNEIKVASYDCASYQLLRELSQEFSHLYVSTGATYDNELSHAVKILKENANEYSLLQCTTIYPTPLHLLNLSRINLLRDLTNNSENVGFSDHSSSSINPNLASMLAIFHGAKIIERHFSILDPKDTKDGPVSIDESNLADLVNFSKLNKDDQLLEFQKININPNKFFEVDYIDRGLSNEELLNRDYYKGRFASVLSLKEGIPDHVISNYDEVPLT